MEASRLPIPVLLVDDDRIHSRVLQARLEREGYCVSMASSGREGLALARELQPVVVLCDWLMEGMDGLEVCRALRADGAIASTYFILLTSRAQVEDRVLGLDSGADDFLTKPVNQEELLARVRSGVRLYQANAELKKLARELEQQKAMLDAEMAEAAGYVRSLLPANDGNAVGRGVTVRSCFVPSHELGGDVYDHFWIDDDHFGLYLADASGHGLAAAFPAISLHNVLRSRSLTVDLRRPGEVLAALNTTFDMENQQGRYLTMWYGVYNWRMNILRYASAGHPPALLWHPGREGSVSRLSGHGMALGIFDATTYASTTVRLRSRATVLLYSDGIYEVPQADGSVGTMEGFIELVEQMQARLEGESGLSELVGAVSRHAGREGFTDDYSLLAINLPGAEDP